MTRFKTAFSLFKNSLFLLINKPAIFLPFLIVAGCEFMVLLIIFLAPHHPFSLVLAPPIRRFFGEIYLHYPNDLFLLPTLFVRFDLYIVLFIGSLMTAVTVAMVVQSINGTAANFRTAFRSEWKNYVDFFLVALLNFFILKTALFGKGIALKKLFLFAKFAGYAGPRAVWGISDLTLGLLIAVLVECFIVYMIPLIVMEKVTIFQSIKDAFVKFKNHFLLTILVVFPYLFIHYLSSIGRTFFPTLGEKTFPEMILVLMAGLILLSLLVNLFLTASVTLFLYSEKKKSLPKNTANSTDGHGLL